MARFSYDDIEADKLILEFKCKECNSLTKTESWSVPDLDFDTFKNVSRTYKHKCQCGACYGIEIINGLYDSYVEIHGISDKEEDVFVYEVPDFPYDKDSILVDTIKSYTIIESIVDRIEDMSKENKNYVYCLLFSNLITILDSFIKIYTEPLVISNDDLIEKFSIVFGMPKGEKEEKIKKIKNYYKQKSFQSINSQHKLFKYVFNVDIEIDDRIGHYVAIRDIIIHRNAIDAGGYMHRITKSQLLQALDLVKEYIRQIFRAVFDFEANLYVQRILNR